MFALALLAPDRADIRRELSPERLALRGYRTRDEPFRDFIAFAGAGVAQEYFYCGVVLMALLPHLGWFAILALWLFSRRKMLPDRV